MGGQSIWAGNRASVAFAREWANRTSPAVTIRVKTEATMEVDGPAASVASTEP